MNYDVNEAGCWVFKGRKHVFGYGWVGNVLAHRVAYQLLVGNVPRGKHVCHTCDNPSCINPAHLFLGTAQDNMRDCSRKGRMNPRRSDNLRPRRGGYRSEKRRLTDAQVKDMRKRHAAGESTIALGAAYKLSQASTWRIVKRLSYSDIP